MVVCQSCGVESPDGFKFCPACGAAFAPPFAEVTPGAATTDERRVVTALFCDLVGFTATSETADPEDVDRMLSAYETLARREIEFHGGVVEKFIGDAVVAVFGVPSAHEDDPERAVRAGLGICAKAAGLRTASGEPLRLRVGINSGEVLARLNIEPGSGQRFMTGDAINTAARIQTIAPEMGVAVGFPTYLATKRTVEYEELDPATLKGKADAVRVFRAIGVQARTGVDLTRSQAGTYIGRREEVARLEALFESTRNGTPVRLVTVIGEAGMGKSRIVAELRGHAQNGAGPVTWRQGRCLPYGEGITFWALGEIVKAHAGILESDSTSVAQEKLEGVLPPGPRQDWLRDRLLPLIGIESAAAGREESFAAWRTFLEGMAAEHPAVVVVEDLHWADEAMLAFLEHVAEQAEHGPLLLLATARPELFARHPDFAASLPNADRLELTPLSTDETADLVSSLVGALVPSELAGPIIERADGNPLYAEEYVRLLRDRELIVETDGAVALRPGVELPLPDSIHSLLAARLDTLPADRKALLTDAAVIGKVFWGGAVATMSGRDPAEVDRGLGELAGLGFLRPAAQSSMAGEHEYAFWHVLGRDVAYRQLPRASRAERHATAATWLEAKLGERVEDIADVLADHWGTALELARAAGQADRAQAFEPKAIQFLTLAGERALNLDIPTAVARFEAALALTTPGHPLRPGILVRYAEAALDADTDHEALVAGLEEAIDHYRAAGDWQAQAGAMVTFARAMRITDRPPRLAPDVLTETLEVLKDRPPTKQLIDALTELGENEYHHSRAAEAIEIFNRCLSIAAELGLPKPGRALSYRGGARLDSGDPGGFDDYREAIELSVAAGAGRQVAVDMVNAGVWDYLYRGPAVGLVPIRAAIAYAAERGIVSLQYGMTWITVAIIEESGSWDEALALYDHLETITPAAGRLSGPVKARILARQGRRDEALALLGALEEFGQRAISAEGKVAFRLSVAIIRATLGDAAAAGRIVGELDSIPQGRVTQTYMCHRPDIVRIAVAAGDLGLAERAVGGVEPPYPYAEHALVAARAVVAEARRRFDEALADYRDAAARWATFTIPLEQGFALLGEGRCLAALGRHAEAGEALAHARSIFEGLGATALLPELEAAEQAAATTPGDLAAKS